MKHGLFIVVPFVEKKMIVVGWGGEVIRGR